MKHFKTAAAAVLIFLILFAFSACRKTDGEIIGKWKTEIDAKETMTEEELRSAEFLKIDPETFVIKLSLEFSADGKAVITTENKLTGTQDSEISYSVKNGRIFFDKDGVKNDGSAYLEYKTEENTMTVTNAVNGGNLGIFSIVKRFPIEFTKAD